MAIKTVQKVGNSKGIILTQELKVAGLGEEVEVTVQGENIIIGPVREGTRRLRVGKNRQSREDAMQATLSQYGEAFQRLADADGK